MSSDDTVSLGEAEAVVLDDDTELTEDPACVTTDEIVTDDKTLNGGGDNEDDRPRKAVHKKRKLDPEKIPDIIANNVKKQRIEVWKKTVMMGPVHWDDMEDPKIESFMNDAGSCALIYRKKPNDSSDCHLELRFINHGDAANVGDKLERPLKLSTGHTVRRRTRMPLESQLQDWDQLMFSRMYMGNRLFVFVDNIPSEATKEDIFVAFPTSSYITFTLKPDMLSGFSVLEYRNEVDVNTDLDESPKVILGQEVTYFELQRTTQFHDRGRPVNKNIVENRGRYGPSHQSYGSSHNSSYGPQIGNELENILLQEIGRKVMMQSGMGMFGQGGGGRSNRFGGGRW